MSNITLKEFDEMVGESIGNASMCWSEFPSGVFETTRALRIKNDIVSAHLSQVEYLLNIIEQINKEEINSMRPGGYYSKSAILSYEALKLYDRIK